MNGQHIDLPYQIPSREFDTRSASLPPSTFDAIGDDATIGVAGFDPGSDESAAGVTLTMDGFSAAYAKLRKSCEESARDAIAAAPWASPVAVPYTLAAKSPDGQSPAVSQNTPAGSAPPTPGETVRSAANATGSPAQADPMKPGCTLQIADAPQHMTGRVTGFVSGDQALAGTRAAEAQLGAKISPAYLSLKRVKVEAYPQSGDWTTLAAIPEHIAVKIGDLVDLSSRYRDPALPCNFIPWTINRPVDHAG